MGFPGGSDSQESACNAGNPGSIPGKNTQKNYTKKVSKTQINQDGVITQVEPDILECEVKWALGRIITNKASGGDGILAELVKIPKLDAVQVLYSMSANLENSAVATGLEKVSFHFNIKEGQCQRMFKL